MARLRSVAAEDSDSDIPVRRRRQPLQSTPSARQLCSSSAIPGEAVTADSKPPARLVPKLNNREKSQKPQVRLAALKDTSFLKTPIAAEVIKSTAKPRMTRPVTVSSSQKTLDLSAAITKPSPAMANQQSARRDTDCADVTDLQSIGCASIDGFESSSDEDLPSLRKFLSRRPLLEKRSLPRQSVDLTKHLTALTILDNDPTANIKSPTKISPTKESMDSRPQSASDKENVAILHFSPPRFNVPRKVDPVERPSTPPQLFSPTKSRLKSPSKQSARIPTPPLRPSLDAFWTADAVNDWNDQYSPKKTLKSPRKLFFRQDPGDSSPTTSPRKPSSPFKRTKAELEARKDFEARKVALAEAFLQELDQEVTNGEIQQLAQSTGGVKLIWSKTLNSTAGRANWRRETSKSKSPEDEAILTQRHFASIELATKVIDCEDRLLNVIAHEFCHLANFMISGVKDQPHGKQFKEWGRRCTRIFGDRGVEVRTKHTYEIEYKYIWQCTSEDCGMEYKRHSKSIDPSTHRCGGCRSHLAQVKPVPRRAKIQAEETSKTPARGIAESENKTVTVTGYAAYVKQHFALLKKSMPGAPHKEVMEALGRKYRADKFAGNLKQHAVDDLADALATDLAKIEIGGGSDNPVVIAESE